MSTAEERIAVLETRSDQNTADIQKVETTLEVIRDGVAAIRLKMEKNISFIGGISFTFSLLGAALAAGIEYVLGRLNH